MQTTRRGDLTDRRAFLEWAQAQFGTEPEYLWLRYPGYAVLRNPSSGKWYAVVLDVPAEKLGLEGAEKKDVLNVKCDPLLIGSLLSREGFVPAYHMSKTGWIGVLLDDTASEGGIKQLVKASFETTSPKKRKKGQRDPRI